MSSAYQFASIVGNDFNASGSADNSDAITIAGLHSRVLSNRFYAAGRANITGQSCLFANNYVFGPSASATQGAVEVSYYAQVDGNHIDGDWNFQTGTPRSVCTGIKASGGWSQVIHNNLIRRLNNATGIDATAGSSSSIQGNYIVELNGGTPILPGPGSLVHNNFGYGLGTLVWDPANLADGAGETSAAIAVAGAALGDYVEVAAPYDLQGMTCTAFVSSAGNVKIRLQNETVAAINLGSDTWRVSVRKQ